MATSSAIRMAAACAVVLAAAAMPAAATETYPVVGRVSMAEGTMQVLPSNISYGGAMLRVDLWVRTRKDNGQLGLCMAYIQLGGESALHVTEEEYPRQIALLVEPAGGGEELEIDLGDAPAYAFPEGKRLSGQDFKGKTMACIRTDLPWHPSYERDGGVAMRIASRVQAFRGSFSGFRRR